MSHHLESYLVEGERGEGRRERGESEGRGRVQRGERARERGERGDWVRGRGERGERARERGLYIRLINLLVAWRGVYVDVVKRHISIYDFQTRLP